MNCVAWCSGHNGLVKEMKRLKKIHHLCSTEILEINVFFFYRALILKSKHYYKIRLILSVRGKRDACIFIHLFWNACIPIIKTCNLMHFPTFKQPQILLIISYKEK